MILAVSSLCDSGDECEHARIWVEKAFRPALTIDLGSRL
jgi:hypothetical protein